MSTILFLTDSHVRGTAPVSRTDNYLETVCEKLRWVVAEANRLKVDAIIHGGDLFDTPNTSEDVAGCVAEIFRSADAPIYVVPGNHDLFGQQLKSLPYTKLGLLARSGVVHILTRESGPVQIGDFLVTGQEYHPGIDHGNPTDWQCAEAPGLIPVLIYHGMLLDREPGFDVPHITLIQAAAMTNACFVLAGHYHPGWPSQVVGRTEFHNPGSLVRTDVSTGNRDRMPKVLLLQCDSAGAWVNSLPVKIAKPGDQVLTAIHITQAAAKASALSAFKETLQQAKITVSEEGLLQSVSQDVDQAVVQKALDALGAVTTEREAAPQHTFHLLHLENFQSHTDTTVEFDPGVTAIVGPSNAGKTALIRAIRWAALNQPTGAGFIRTGAKRASVTLTTAEGTSIIRSRTPSSSGTLTINGSEYRGFTRNLPPELFSAHGIMPLDLQGVKLLPTLALQHDPPFLLSLSPGQRALAVAPLGGATRIEAAVRSLGTEETRLTAQIRTIEARQSEIAAALERLAGVAERRERLRRALALLEQAEGHRQTAAAAEAARRDYREAMLRRQQLANRLLLMAAPPDIDRLCEALRTKAQQSAQATQLQRRHSTLKTERASLAASLPPDPAPVIGPLADRLAYLKQVQLAAERYQDLMAAREAQAAQCAAAKERVAELEAQRAALAGAGAVCPLCGQPLEKDSAVLVH